MSGSRRLHVVVDDDAAVDVEAGLAAELDVRPDAGGDDDEVGFDASCRPTSAHALDVPVAEDGRRRAAEQHLDAEVFHLAGEVVAAVRIELALHQRRHQVHDGDVAALHLQSARGFEAEQAAADHHGLDAGAGALEQLARVVERAEDEDAVLVDARRSAA